MGSKVHQKEINRCIKITYDPRFIPAHGENTHAQVLLVNEAPGPDEAASRIPLYGQQGANLFHALRAAGIAWAVNHEKFEWPKNDCTVDDGRQRQKKSFLAKRSEYITCTNSYPYWPKPSNDPNNFCPPCKDDINKEENIKRISNQISPDHSALLICGVYAYLAFVGNDLSHPANREFKELTKQEIKLANARLNSQFKMGWYMGHTRRWSFNRQKCSDSLKELANYLHWPLAEKETSERVKDAKSDF